MTSLIASALRPLFAVCLALYLGSGIVCSQPRGAIDTSFGTNGIATNNTVTGSVHSLVGLGDGKVLGAGECLTSFGNGVCLYRWTSAGAADSAFGINGVSFVFAHPFAVFPRIAVRPDGRIVVAFTCPSGAALCVLQSNPNGTAYDPTFAGGSFTTLPVPSAYASVFIADIALQPDGKLLVGGSCSDISFAAFSYCVIRLLPNAQIDSTFGASPDNWSVTTPGPGDSLTMLTLLPDGRYLASGGCGAGLANSAICVLRYFSNGSFQSSFSVNVANNIDRVHAVRVVGSSVTISGESTNSTLSFANRKMLAARREVYAPFGAADTSYGGTYPTSGLVSSATIDSGFDSTVLSSAIMSDGGIVYAGKCNGSNDVCLARVAPNGNVDTSFGIGGSYQYVGYPYPDNGSSFNAVLTEAADGKILLGGYCAGGRPCVYRFNDVVQSAPKCSLDIDGDGVIRATTDGLILLRTMLGFSGASALTNAVGAGASRPTWPQVREYLSDQCRMPVSLL